MHDDFSSFAVNMFFIWFLVCSAEAITRSYIDAGCNATVPVFSAQVGGDRIGCFGKHDLVVGRKSWQSVYFYDVNYIQSFRVRHPTKMLGFDGKEWVGIKLKIMYHLLTIVPVSGQLLYVRDRRDSHLFFRTFGHFGPLITTRSPSTPRSLMSSAPSSVQVKFLCLKDSY